MNDSWYFILFYVSFYSTIPFYVVDGEADEEIVAVANYYRCPVLAEDSDFYIFNIEGGYIPLQYFLDSQMSKARVCYAPNFAEQFAFQDPALRFLIPAILGNDILKKVPYPGFDKLTTLVKSISRYPTLKEFLDQVPDRVDKKSLHENCSKAAALYGVKLVRNPAELSGFTNLNLPKWILDRYRKGCFAPQMVLAAMTQKIILSTVVDDIKSRCAQYVGLRIRQHIYGILVHQPVQESMRDEKSTTLTDHLTKYRMLKPSLSLKEVSDLKVTEATQILCSVLCCYEAVDRIEELPAGWRLVAASCIYWYRKAKPTPQHHLVKALVLCLILCNDSVFPILGQNVAQSDGSFLEALHAFAQWQCTYFDAVALNQLLMEPFQYTSPAYLYSGEIAMQCAALCSRSEMPTLKLTQDQSKLYDCLMALIKSGSEHGTKTGLQREKELTKQMAPAEKLLTRIDLNYSCTCRSLPQQK